MGLLERSKSAIELGSPLQEKERKEKKKIGIERSKSAIELVFPLQKKE